MGARETTNGHENERDSTVYCVDSGPSWNWEGVGTTVARTRKDDNVFLFMDDLERPRVADTTLARASFLSRLT